MAVYVKPVETPQDDELPVCQSATEKPVTFESAKRPAVGKKALARRHDAQMHSIISAVAAGGIHGYAWLNCVETLTRDINNLRPGVLFHFFSVCKFLPAEKAMWEKLRQGSGWYPVAEKVMHEIIDTLEKAGNIGSLRNYFKVKEKYQLPPSVRQRLWGSGDADGVFKTISSRKVA